MINILTLQQYRISVKVFYENLVLAKLICITLFSLLITSCTPSFYENTPMSELGDLDQFFKNKRTISGRSTVNLVSKNAVSISFIYQTTFVKDYEVANAAQHHCQKYSKNALEISDELYNDPYYKIVFECK